MNMINQDMNQEINPGMNHSERLHYMDNLRALAMLVGVVFHASLAFGPLMQNIWFTASGNYHWGFDVFNWFSHLFRMPLFFLIAGYFALMLLKKHGVLGFLKHRSMRILLPLLLFLPLLFWLVGLTISWAIEHVDNLPPMLFFIKMMFSAPATGTPPETPFSSMHLWFLYYLYMLVVVVALLYKLKVFTWRVWSWCLHPVFLLLLMPVLLAVGLFQVPAPHPAPEQAVPQWWALLFYGLFFFLGGLMQQQHNTLTSWQPYKYLLLLVSLAVFTYFYKTIPDVISPQMAMMLAGNGSMSWSHLPVALAESVVALYMTLFCLLLGQRYLNRSNKQLKLWADASYWIYLIHLPLLFMVQFYLMDSGWHMGWQFLTSCAVTLGVGMLSYLVMVRPTPLGWLLNGRKK
ncbi:acyltransferase family protein [Marinicella rhabdoformis]|uniref:acyltransferase family protein n=1 Tax=Marinicella rhabdoformis TaxID=2580566 RepID=UPI0012AECD9A|nr:acyltransferase family protein [Marinicella rhabdoformis]